MFPLFSRARTEDFGLVDITRHLPKTILVAELMELARALECDFANGPWMAGGAVLSMFTCDSLHDDVNNAGGSDIDVFTNTISFEHFLRITENNPKLGTLHMPNKGNSSISFTHSSNLHSQSNKTGHVSINNKFPHKSVYSLLYDFDFTVCAITTDGRRVLAHPLALKDIQTRHIRLINVNNKRRSIYRLGKYITKGYIPRPGVLKTLIGDTTELSEDLRTPSLRWY